MNRLARTGRIAAFRDALLEARDRAWAGARVRSTCDLELAGHPVRCHFAGASLAPLLMPALAHHRSDGGREPLLDVYVWAGDESASPAPRPPWQPDADTAWQHDSEDHFAIHLPLLGSLLWLDRKRRIALYHVPSAAHLPLTEQGSPLLLLWGAWLADFGVHLVHAAAVSGRRGAALLLGPGGAGKSSAALACLGAGRLRYLGDDYCLVRSEPQPEVLSLYASGKVYVADRDHHRAIEHACVGDNGEKSLYQFHPAFDARLCTESPIVALISMQRGNAGALRLAPMAPMHALRAVAPNSLLQIRVGIRSAATLSALARIARQVDCFALEGDGTREEVASLLERCLER